LHAYSGLTSSPRPPADQGLARKRSARGGLTGEATHQKHAPARRQDSGEAIAARVEPAGSQTTPTAIGSPDCLVGFGLGNRSLEAMVVDGLVTIRSDRGPAETMNRLEAAVKERGLTVFGRIDHAAGAKEVGLPLRPTSVLIFGNAKGGSPLMQSVQTIGIDLPLKVLVWEDASDVTWLSYNDPSWLAKRHGLPHGADAVAGALAATLGAIVKMAAD